MNLFKLLNPYFLTEAVRKKKPLEIQREIILQFLLNAVSVWGVIGLIQYLVRARIGPDNLALVLPFIITIALQVFLTVTRRLPFQIRAIGLAVLVLIESMESLLREGLSGNGMVYGIAFVAVIAVLIGPRAGLLSVFGFITTQILVGWAMVTGRMDLPDIATMANSGVASAWISSVLSVLLVATSIAAAFFQLTGGLNSALNKQQNLAEELEKERDLLEVRVADRTQELSRKAAQLEAARQVAAVLANEMDTKQLLTIAVDVIKEQFGYYHAGIFLNNPQNTSAVLEASTGEAGKKMLDNHHQLRIGEVGIVGYVAARGEPRVSADVTDDPNYYPNPILPETRSEMAVPLRSGDNVVGVLDVQSTHINAFKPDDVEVIATIANQISLAMENARLLQELKTSLAELETIARQSTAKAWDTHLRGSRKRYTYQYQNAKIQTGTSINPAERNKALKQGSTIITPDTTSGQPETSITVPIKLRNQTLGVINMRIRGAKASPELVELVENTVNRLAISLENVRLVEELQIRAERERLVSDVASKVRSATDIESILRTAANEIGRSLGVSEVVVQLNSLK